MMLVAALSLYSDAVPPQRFQGDVNARVEFVRSSAVEPRCRAIGFTMPLRRGDTVLACSGNATIVIPNPCLYAAGDGYARLLCHELGHVNGWPATHDQ